MTLGPLNYFPCDSRPREWQVSFLAKFEKFANVMLEESPSNRDVFVLNAFPGSGKTWAQLAAMKWLIETRQIDFLVICVPTGPLRKQFAKDARAFGLNLLAPSKKSSLRVDFTLHQGVVVTYEAMRQPNNGPILAMWCRDRRVMISADEMHHLAKDSTWGNSFVSSFSNSVIRLMTTGTPFRSDGGRIPWVRYAGDEIDLSGPFAYNFGYGFNRWNQDLCALYGHVGSGGKGACVRDVVFHPWDGEISWSINSPDGNAIDCCHRLTDNLDEIYEGESKALIDVIRKSRRRAAIECGSEKHPLGTGYVQEQIKAAHANLMNIRQSHPWAGGLIVCQDRKHADAVANAVRHLTGTEPVVVHGDMDSAYSKLEAYQEDKTLQRAPWLIAVRMVTEGVDVKHLRVCVYLTTVTAAMFWVQVLGRILRLESGAGDQQTAHFYQYDDGIDLVEGEPQDVRLRHYAKEITKELEAVQLKRQQDKESQASESGGGGSTSDYLDWRQEVVCHSATGEADHVIFNGDEHQIADLAIFELVARLWCEPAAKIKSKVDKLPLSMQKAFVDELRAAQEAADLVV